MARIMEPIFQIHQPMQQKDPIKANGPTINLESTAGKLSSKLFLLLFYLHLILLSILITFLTLRGIFTIKTHRRNLLLHWYPSLFTSSTIAALTAIICQVAIRKNPSKTLKAIFWLSPSLTCAVGILFLSIGTASSLIVSAFAFIFALIQSLYGCWVVPRKDYATRILLVSVSAPISNATNFLLMFLVMATFYSVFAISGLGGVIKMQTRIDPVFVFVILLSLVWTMHVLKNTMQVTVSRPVYQYFTRVTDVDTRVALDDTVKNGMGSICLGSILVPIIGIIRGLSRVMSSIAGDTDEFMFSCASCYAGLTDRLVAYGNRWGFVHVGVYGKGFVCASVDTWEMFERVGMKSLIDSDLTGTICFLCAVAGGSFCTLVAGSWALFAHKDYAFLVSIYAFFIGYLLIRIAMAWPQACVSAYYVAFAENPQGLQFDSTIRNRLQVLQRSQV